MGQSTSQDLHVCSSGKFMAEMTCARDCFLSLQMLHDKKCPLLHYAEHSSSGGRSTKTGWQKDTHWLQLRPFRAVARAVVWRLGQGHVSAAWHGMSEFNQVFFFTSEWSLYQIGALMRSASLEVRCHSPEKQFPCKWFGLAESYLLYPQPVSSLSSK